MHSSIHLIVLATISQVSARFGQQNPSPLEQDICNLAVVGGSLCGKLPSTLLGGSDPCDKLKHADEIVAGSSTPEALEVAKRVIHTESNFNNFAAVGPKFCADPTLPATAELRGILSIVSDEGVPAFGANGGKTAAEMNAIAKQSLVKPLDASGKSVLDLYVSLGFKNAVNAASAGQATKPVADNTAGNAGKDDQASVVFVTKTVTVDCQPTN